MSLREEIDKILWNMPSFRDDILKLFEKRIDSMFRSMLEDVSKDMTREQMNYIEPRFLSALEKQKKEFLK